MARKDPPLPTQGFIVQQQQQRHRDTDKSSPAAGFTFTLTLWPPKPPASQSPVHTELNPQPPAPSALSKAVLYELRLTSKQPTNLACRDN